MFTIFCQAFLFLSLIVGFREPCNRQAPPKVDHEKTILILIYAMGANVRLTESLFFKNEIVKFLYVSGII